MSHEPHRIASEEELCAALAAPRFLLFKHSTICPVSAAAFREYEAFLRSDPGVPSGWIDVTASKPLARDAAERTGVRHESPQALLVRDGSVAWHASHGGITAATLAEAVGGRTQEHRMRGLVMTGYGGPEVLTLRDDLPEPVMEPHDLLVEVHACGLNPVDTKIRRGYLGERVLPTVLGFDVSGVVRAVGPEAQGFAVGDEVYASPSLGRPGANAALVAVDSRLVAQKPRTLDHVRAAALPLVTITAWEALFDRAAVQEGETVLIHAGGGGVGHVALQLARHHGCRVITTASHEDSLRLCSDLGADVAVNYREEDFVERVMEETGGAGCPVVFDTVGGAVFERTLDCVAVGGRVVTIVYNETSAIFEKLFRKNATLHFEFMGAPALHGIGMEAQQDILRQAAELADAGRLTPHVARVIGLADVPEAHRDLEAGHVTGKVVVDLAL